MRLWALLLVPMALALVLAYVGARHTLGPTAGTRRFRVMLPIMLGGMVLVVLLLRFAPGDGRIDVFAVFNVGFVLLICGLVGYMQYRTQQAGALLLDLGQPRALLVVRIIGFVMLALAIVSTVLTCVERELTIEDVDDILFRIAFGILLVLIGTRRVQLREQGLLASGDLLRWREITGYHWEADRPNTLTLQVNTRRLIGKRPSLPIAPKHRDAVDRLLAQYVRRAPAARRA